MRARGSALGWLAARAGRNIETKNNSQDSVQRRKESEGELNQEASRVPRGKVTVNSRGEVEAESHGSSLEIDWIVSKH
jgi:hypothetical protein